MNAKSPSDLIFEGTSPAPERLTLASYNIHRCYGRDGRCVPGRIADVLREIRADVVAVQEVETQAEGGIRILEALAQETGSTMIPGPTMFRAGAQYGNALLTRLPVQSVALVDLSVPGARAKGRDRRAPGRGRRHPPRVRLASRPAALRAADAGEAAANAPGRRAGRY